MDFNISEIAALAQVILIDLALAGDNAIAVGLAASALPKTQQRTAIIWGIVLALVLRIFFSLLVIVGFQNIPYLMLIGGLLLFWVAWRMWQDIRAHEPVTVGAPEQVEHAIEGVTAGGKHPTTFGRALLTIVLADVSMSLDNVLAVAAVAMEHPAIMAFGLVLSVILMGVAASIIARFIQRFRWIAIVGILIIIFAAFRMVWEGGYRDFPEYIPPLPTYLGGVQH
ncbi:MAG: YjbE family putative metal transport protein [Caulobacteraceae bacterium]